MSDELSPMMQRYLSLVAGMYIVNERLGITPEGVSVDDFTFIVDRGFEVGLRLALLYPVEAAALSAEWDSSGLSVDPSLTSLKARDEVVAYLAGKAMALPQGMKN